MIHQGIFNEKKNFTLQIAEIHVDVPYVNFKNCPYDFTEIDIQGYECGVYIVSCPSCSAQWETHSNWVARVKDPNWEIVKAFQEIQSLQTTRD